MIFLILMLVSLSSYTLGYFKGCKDEEVWRDKLIAEGTFILGDTKRARSQKSYDRSKRGSK